VRQPAAALCCRQLAGGRPKQASALQKKDIPSPLAVLSARVFDRRWTARLRFVYYCHEMNVASPVYEEIIDFIAAGATPEAIIGYRPSPEAQQRVAELVAREKTGDLLPDEKSELDHFLDLEHILRMAKAKARQVLARG
jgi:hypothetical protein